MSDNNTKTIKLSNQRRFNFSSKTNFEELNELIIEARILYKTIIDLPILPNLASSLEEEMIQRSIFGTTAIEGNPLKENEVSELIQTDSTESKNKAEQEIYNIKNTYQYIEEIVSVNSDDKINLEMINSIHKKITENIIYDGNIPGSFRKHSVKVGDREHGGIYTPPKIFKDIKFLMNEFVIWLNSEKCRKLNPIIRASIAHYHLGIIHPFGQGNGRTTRAIETLILRKANIKYVPLMLSNYYYQNIDEYYWAYSNTLKHKGNEVTPFLKFTLIGFVEALNEIKDRITYFIRRFTLRDYYSHLLDKKEVSKRQFLLVNTLLKLNITFEVKELLAPPFISIFKGVSQRTIQRDMKNLLDKEIIVVNNEKFNLNWGKLG